MAQSQPEEITSVIVQTIAKAAADELAQADGVRWVALDAPIAENGAAISSPAPTQNVFASNFALYEPDP